MIKNTLLLIQLLFSVFFAILTFIAGLKYEGDIFIYMIFCAIFLLLFADMFRGKNFYSYVFLVIFLILGFWCKFILHLIFPYPFMEPVGQFDYEANSWDLVLTISSIGIFGVFTAKNVFFSFFGNASADENSYAPEWYRMHRNKILFFVSLMIFLLPFLNLYFGIAQAGLIASLKLPWPLNGLIAWSLGFGLAIVVATIIHWDQSLSKKMGPAFFLLISEGFFSTISTLSRAAYIFHTVPALFVFVKDNVFGKWHIRIFAFGVWFLFLCASLVIVTLLRYSDSSPVDATNNKTKFSAQTSVMASEITRKVSRLVVDRWIGLEGVMAVVSYQDKGVDLFYEALAERRVTGKVDIYTDRIAQAGLTNSDLEKFQYATIPGAIAFFYYSDSYLILFLGIFSLVFLMMLLEIASFRLTKNKYIAAFWGMGAAQAVASFGLGLPQQLVYYSVCFAALGMIYVLQKYSKSAI
jgi:hypothetical protein